MSSSRVSVDVLSVADSPRSPLVTVVLPTHDRPERLAGSLGSVLNQTYRRLEVLVIDDASEHPVDDVVERIADGDHRVRLQRLSTNRGAAGARNEGLERASGEFVAFIDDDDRWEPEKIDRQLAYLLAHPEVGAVSCDYFIDHEGRPDRLVRFRGAREFTTAQLCWINFVHGFSLVVARRSLIGETLRIDENFRCAEDWDLWLRCAMEAPFARISEPLAHYVSHPQPRLTDPEEKRFGLERFLDKHGTLMSPTCRAFHVAHQRMEHGSGWSKRLRTLESLTAPSRASPVLLLEQMAWQTGRLRHDPGFAERSLVLILPKGRRDRARTSPSGRFPS